MPYSLGFIGAGNMAEAIARAAIDKRVLPPGAMIASDLNHARRDVFATLGMAIAADNADVIRHSGQILLAVKPQQLEPAAKDLAAHLRDEQVVVTILAGINTGKLAGAIMAHRPAGSKLSRVRVVRVMPNTPLQVGLGMAGIALGAQAEMGDAKLALDLFSAGGKAIVVDEKLIDAITAVSGSGPAYVFYLAEAMERGARELGLAEHASLLVRQTILGAAQLLSQSPDAAAELRRKVSSPGGTTEAAIKHMEGNKTIEVVVNAIKAAEKRSKELGY